MTPAPATGPGASVRGVNEDAPRIDRLDLLEQATTRFAGLLARSTGDEAVPSCPGWTVRDLAVHLGRVHRWAAGVVLTAQLADRPEPIIGGSLTAWYSGVAGALLAALRAVDPAEYAPNLSSAEETVAFWHRRQLHETAVHTVDLAFALGGDREKPDFIGPELAADGVQELVTAIFRRLTERSTPPIVTESILLRATDTGDAWVLGPGQPPELLAVDTPVAASIAGPAADLYLGLWGRVPHDRLEVRGDAAAALLAGPTSN